MLYQWKFSIIDKDGEVLRVDEIIAPTASDADFIYKHNTQSWTHEELQVFHFFENRTTEKFGYKGVESIMFNNKIQIDCLGEVEVKLKTESPIPVVNVPEELPYYPIDLLIINGGFKKVSKDQFDQDKHIIGEHIYVYQTPGGKTWNLWPNPTGWQVVYYGCTSVTTVYSANDFYELYKKIEGKPFPLNSQIPGHNPDDDDPGLPPRTTNRHSGGVLRF